MRTGIFSEFSRKCTLLFRISHCYRAVRKYKILKLWGTKKAHDDFGMLSQPRVGRNPVINWNNSDHFISRSLDWLSMLALRAPLSRVFHAETPPDPRGWWREKKFAFSREFGRYPLSKYVGALKQLIAEYPTIDNPKINGFRRDERGVLERLVFQLRFPCQMLSIFLLWCGNLIT